jgi:hypothetical protein
MRSRTTLTLTVTLTVLAAGAAGELARQAGSGRLDLLLTLAAATVVIGAPLVAAIWVGLAAVLLRLVPRPSRPHPMEASHGSLPPLPRPLGLPPLFPAQDPGQRCEAENF